MALKSITEADLKGKKVLARFDFNVPLKNGQISDSSRIDLALPTIRFLLEQGISKLTLMSHLGRPKGKVNPDLSLEPVADYLANQLNEEVILTESAISNGVKELLTLKSTNIVLLENLRFHPQEEQNDNEFAKSLSDYGEIYVNDAFGAAHRKHASVYNINKYFPNRAYAGLLLKAEIDSLNKILHSPKKPFMAIIGGAKISDKIKTIEKLLVNVDKLFIGGAMAYPFLKAKGQSIGNSLCNEEDIKLAKNILKADKGKKLVLPIDHMIVEKFGAKPITSKNTDIEEGYMGIDIGPKTIAHYQDLLKSAQTILWNGPMGVFENPDYAKGTMSLCETIAGLDAFSLVGGGDSVSAVNKSGLAQKFSHVSTGGGASLEYIEKGELPGIQALKFGV